MPSSNVAVDRINSDFNAFLWLYVLANLRLRNDPHNDTFFINYVFNINIINNKHNFKFHIYFQRHFKNTLLGGTAFTKKMFEAESKKSE